MIPLRDDNPAHGHVPVTIALIVLNCAVFLFEVTRGQQGMEAFIWKYGYVPAELTLSRDVFERKMVEGGQEVVLVDRLERPVRDIFGNLQVKRVPLPIEEAEAVSPFVNIFTCMFLHGGWMHLIGNMLYLWIFGNNIEDKLGSGLFLAFYLVTGVAGNLAHTWWDASVAPLVGASGAISGVMGAYVMLFPHAKILAVVPAGWYWFTVRLPAWIFLGVYILIQNLFPAYFGAMREGEQGGVAYWAHIGGFAAGFAFIRLLPHRKRPGAPHRPRPIPDRDVDFDV